MHPCCTRVGRTTITIAKTIRTAVRFGLISVFSSGLGKGLQLPCRHPWCVRVLVMGRTPKATLSYLFPTRTATVSHLRLAILKRKNDTDPSDHMAATARARISDIGSSPEAPRGDADSPPAPSRELIEASTGLRTTTATSSAPHHATHGHTTGRSRFVSRVRYRFLRPHPL